MTQPNGMDIPQIYAPDATGGPTMRISHIGEGRLVVINPTEFEPNAPAFDDGETGPRITADIAVLDGPLPLQYGGSIQKKRPHNMEFRSLPALVRGVWIQEKSMVFQLKGRIGLGVVVGRLGKGVATKGNAPWVIFDPTPAEIEQARAWLTAKAMGQWTAPEPVEIGGTQPTGQAAPPPGGYAQPASPGYGYQPPQGQPAPQYGQQPPQQPQGQPNGYPQGYGYPQGQPAPQGQPQAAPWQPPVQEPPMPPGFNPQQWAVMTPQDKINAANWYAQQAQQQNGQYGGSQPNATQATTPAGAQGAAAPGASGPAYW